MYEVIAKDDRTGRVLLVRRVQERGLDRLMAQIAIRDLGAPFHLVATPYTPIWS